MEGGAEGLQAANAQAASYTSLASTAAMLALLAMSPSAGCSTHAPPGQKTAACSDSSAVMEHCLVACMTQNHCMGRRLLHNTVTLVYA